MTLDGKNNPYLRHEKNRKRVDKLWETFHVRGAEEAAAGVEYPYEHLILGDWSRCKGMGVDSVRKTADVLTEDELRCLSERKSFLIDKARLVLERVQDFLSGVPGILICTDEEGTVLHVAGDPAIREKAADGSNLVEGGRWSEAAAGTNGIGTAIARKAPVHVYASEHFCESWHRWTCAGSPISDPFQNEIVGVIDFTTSESDFRQEALALSHSLANNITGELRVQVEMERLQLVHQYSVCSARFPSDGVLVYDRLGLLVRSSPGIDPAQYSFFSHDLTVFTEAPKEVRPILVQGTQTPIGTLLVVSRPRPRPHSLTSGSPPAPAVSSFGDFVTVSDEVKRVLGRIEKVAATDLSILLIGETGTGKELVANYVHRQSGRRAGPFVAVNCGAISKELFESKFFGYERGGFTGADPKGRRGLFESAQDGTLFLDEIGELPLDMQAGLLRVLETGVFRRIGSDRERSSNSRVIAATNRPLLEGVERGTFRSDLYYRLSVATAAIPPLRDRREDLPVLIDHMTRVFCKKHNLPLKTYTSEVLQILAAHDWPGNARELRNVIEATLVCADDPIVPGDLPAEMLGAQITAHEAHALDTEAKLEGTGGGAPDSSLSIREHERRLILSALKKYKKISLVAGALGISRSTLYRRFEELGIDHIAVSSSSRKPS